MRLGYSLLLALLLPAAAVRADSVTELPLPANDLVYDAPSGLIYASVPGRVGASGNSITRFDPLSGEVIGSVFVGSEPGPLARTDDGSYLYVGLNGAAAVRRYDLGSHLAGPQFSVESPVQRLVALPGQPHSLAVLAGVFFSNPLMVFDAGVRRPNSSAIDQLRLTDVLPSLSPGRLYGADHTSVRVDVRGGELQRVGEYGSGVTDLDITGNRSQRGLLFAPTGKVIDPEADVLLGTFALNSFYGPHLVCPDLPNGRAYFLTRTGADAYELQAYDARTYTPAGTLPLPALTQYPHSLIRWGDDGLAFAAGDKVYLVRTSLVPQGSPEVDLQVHGVTLPGEVAAGETLTYTLSVHNQGSHPATFVSLTDTLPVSTSDLSAVASQGQVYVAGGVVTARLGDLAPGATATVTVQARFKTAGPATHTAVATAFEADTDNSNDQATHAVTVTAPLLAELNAEWTQVKVICPPRGKCRYIGRLRLRNSGGQDARRFTVRFYATSRSFGTTNLLGEVKVRLLRRGKTATLRLNKRQFAPTFGEYDVRAVVDASAVVVEANEDDNTAVSATFNRGDLP